MEQLGHPDNCRKNCFFPMASRNAPGEIALLLMASFLLAASPVQSLTIQAPPGVKVLSAHAISDDPKQDVPGKIQENQIGFEKLVEGAVFDVRVDLADGGVMQGVNLAWYDEEPAKADAGELTEDDRTAIKEIIDVPSFYNKSTILTVRGDHSRATVLVQLVRDKDFYHGGGEVIWRVELWFFEQNFGGWEKVAQQNRILRRERFKTHDAFEAVVAKLKWVPELGGIIMSGHPSEKIVKLDVRP